MLCVVVLEVEDGDFSDLKFSALDVHSGVMHLSMLICWGGGKPGIGGGFELCSNAWPQGSHPGSKNCKFLTPGALLLVKRVQIPQPHLPPKNA